MVSMAAVPAWRREGGKEGLRKGRGNFCGEVGRYGCQNDGLGELDTMVREGGRRGEREGGREEGRTSIGEP